MRINKRLIMLIATLLVLVVVGTVGAQAAEAATVVNVPQGYGYGTLHTYTVWDKIRWGGNCRKLINFAKEQNAISDSYGIVTYGDYFCGALTSTFGKVGDMMLVVEEGNIVYPVIMADTKNQSNRGCNAWGHQYGKCVVEFEILSSCRKSLYGASGGYVSDALAKPIVKVINLGSVWDSTYYLWNPKQACLDNGLEGYTLLTNPYGGEVVKAEDPQQTIAPAGNLVYASLEKPSVKTTESNHFSFLISWFDKLIA